MDHRNRDMGINYIKTRKKHPCYGMGLGIIVLDDPYPGFPGDVRNASAFPYPIQYEIAEGVDNYTLVWKEDKSPCLEPIKRAAKRLEQIGCRAIAAECGYFAYFQKDIAGYVDIPVFMSSLLQVPFIQQVIGPQKAVGIVCAQKRFLTDTHLQNVGIDPDSNFFIAGALDEYGCPEFTNLWDPEKRPECPESHYDQASVQSFAAPIQISARSCWNAPACSPLRGQCSAWLICRFLAGARCWTMPIRWLCIGIITGTYS
jgi:hypothetical protein